MAEQVTLNHSVRGSSPWRLTNDKGGGPVTLVAWAFAPEWLTIEEASTLSGHPLDVLNWLIEDGAIDTRHDGRWLIEKASLREFQETLAEVLHWYD